MAIQLKDQSQPDRNFRGRHRQNKDKNDLPVRLAPARTGNDKRQACSVQHDLERHQNEKDVTPDQQADQSQREQNPRQEQSLMHRHGCHHESPISP